MKVTLTRPTAGAGKWAWTGWANALLAMGHEIVPLGDDTDLLINSTSSPSDELIAWRQCNMQAKVAMNVLAWTDADLPGLNNPGVQATPNNVEYARAMHSDVVFAQFTPTWREVILSKWKSEGFKLASMEMAADDTAYRYTKPEGYEHDLVFCGGYWAYKARNIDQYLMPVLIKHRANSYLVGKGWNVPIDPDCGELALAQKWGAAKVCPNVHEPHSTDGGYDVVERVFKTMFCGGLCVTDPVEELESGYFFEHGEHLIIADGPQHYAEIIDEVISRPWQYEHIKEAGRLFVKNNHTYKHRVTALLEELGCGM